MAEDRGSPFLTHSSTQIIHLFGNLLRIWSVYLTYWYLATTGASVPLCIFLCLVPSSLIFLILQKPWKGRSLSNQQVVPSVINGAITALYFILWGMALKSCGPISTLLGEYSGASLGVLSTLLYGRRGHLLKKVGGLAAMLVSFFLLSQGWATSSFFPLTYNADVEGTDEVLGFRKMLLPMLAGILSALKRVIARRVSLKNQLKRRLNAITFAAATCFMFPLAIIISTSSDSSIEIPFSPLVFSSNIFFGIILIFYVDSMAEERLHMVFSSPRQLLVTGACVIIMEIIFNMDFSLFGFSLCSLILAIGIYQATYVDRGKTPSMSILENDMNAPTLPN